MSLETAELIWVWLRGNQSYVEGTATFENNERAEKENDTQSQEEISSSEQKQWLCVAEVVALNLLYLSSLLSISPCHPLILHPFLTLFLSHPPASSSLSQSATAVQEEKKPPRVPPYCNLCNNLWLIISQACIPPPWHPQHGLHCSTYSGTLNPSDRINSAALLRIPWISRHPRVQLGHWCHSLKPKRESEHCKHCFYLDFFDIRGGDVAGFPRAAVGPQPPVFVAPLQD